MSTQPPTSILIADHHPLILAGMASLIGGEASLKLVGQASDGVHAVAQYEALRPDLLLIDPNMPLCGGIEAIGPIRELDPTARIVIVSSHDGDEDVHRALGAGASGYLLKSASFAQMLDCIALVMAGKRYVAPELSRKLNARMLANTLSVREREILNHLASGMSNKVIARAAGIGVGTVKFHINNILSKLNVASRTEAAVVAARRGLVHLA